MQTEPTDHEGLLDRVRNQRGVATMLSVAALSFGGIGLAACGEDEPVQDAVTEEPATEETPEAAAETEVEQTTLPRLLENPEDFNGQMVEVAGAVLDEEVVGETNEGAPFLIGDALEEDLLILPQGNLTPGGITEDSIVTVRGTVVEVTQSVAEEEGMGDAFLEEFEGEYAIQATEIEVSESETP